MSDRPVTIVTGAGSGIGRVLALRYAEAGYDLVIAARREEPLRATAEAAEGEGAAVELVVADLRRESDVAAVADAAAERFGRVDVLVNNAAVPGHDQPVAGMTLANWNDTITTNLTAPMLLARDVLVRSMIPSGHGNIQFLSSAAAKAVLPGKAHYAVAKLGLLPLAQTLAVEVGPVGIRVNTLVIGTVAGPLVDGYVTRMADAAGVDRTEIERRLTEGTALGRFVNAGEVADVSLWLASDAASSITGQDINVTAGGEKR